MKQTFLAELDSPEALQALANTVRDAGCRCVDAFTPFPVAGMAAHLDAPRSRIRTAMLIAGCFTAASAYAVQYWSAVYAYPLNVGSRPLHSWPAFLLAPLEVGMLAAALAGLIAFCRQCGLPRLHHALFELPGFERATQDRFFLLAQSRDDEGSGLALRRLLETSGARTVTEAR